MPKLLLALLAIVVVAPASASAIAPATPHKWPCPYEQAKLAAAGYESVDSSTAEPLDGSIFDPSRRSALLP